MDRQRGMTLIELLVVTAIVGVMIALLLPAVQAARATARSAVCKSHLRQVGLAVHQYCMAHDGRFPSFSHDSTDEQGSWVYTLAPYLEAVDEVRICPEDPVGRERLQASSTSYVLNEYIAANVEGAIRNINKLQATSKTIVVFEGSDQRSTAFQNEHVHAAKWFSQINQDMGWVAWAVERDIKPDRHGPTAHYLYADARVDVIPAMQIYQWIEKGYDFAKPR